MGRSLTLEEKVGQLMMFGFAGRTIPQHIRDFILRRNLGGIIHFSRNIKDPEQIRVLNEELQALARQSPGGSDLLISVDQEGGSVVRLTNGVSVSPGNMALGAAASPQLAEAAGEAMGEELRALGFNVNLAPCLDVNNNPNNPVIGVRSFGSDPRLVADLGVAVISGLQKHLLAVAKHFPGHGDTSVDSHLNLPVIAHDWERLQALELLPFQRAIQAGVAGVLAAHLFFPTLEPSLNLPATLSPRVLRGLLREQLGFPGLIFTDCMEMEAITKSYSLAEAAVRTIGAGSDIVLVSHTPSRQAEAYEAVVEAVRTGRISTERIEESLKRIAAAKRRLGSGESSTRSSPRSYDSAKNRKIMESIVRQSLTVVQDQGLLPLQPGEVFVIETAAQAVSIAEEKMAGALGLAVALKEAGFSVQARQIGISCSEEEVRQLVQSARGHSLVLIVTQDAHRHRGQRALVQKMAEVVGRVVVIGARTPYEAAFFPQVPTYIAAYSNRSFVWKEVVALLTGKIEAQGQLPVSLGPNRN